MNKTIIVVTTALAVMGLYSANAQTIPFDSAVRTGKLANGFTYFIRKNNEPQKRAIMYLVNKAGSVLEDDDQQGLAHFMEHMNFNGTKHYPKNELVDYLQKAGVRFGADLNAYTSFDETIYELPIPTDDPKMTVSGLQIMRDWAQEALLDSVEIEKERGVILEEERLGKGAGDRMARKFYPVMLNHSRYSERLPIGLDKVLLNFRPTVIRRFYHDWYRPDLQALIVVGNVNVDKVEKIIQSSFASLKNPENERPRTKYTVPLTGHGQFLMATDPEKASTEIEVLYKHKAPKLITEADYLGSMKSSLLNQLFESRRYAETSREPNPAFATMGMGIQRLLGGLDMLAYDVQVKNGQIRQGFEQSWQIFEKIKRFGFSQAELDLAKQSYLSSMEKGVKEADKTSSDSYVKEYQLMFLQQEASPGIAWEYAFVKAHINDIKLEDIDAVLKEYLRSPDVDMLVLAPEKDKAELPDSVTLISWLKDVAKNEIKPFKDEAVTATLLSLKPAAGKIVLKKAIPQLGITTLTLSNGVKVILKPTEFKNDEIRFTAFSPGGTSLYSDAEYDNATNAAALISRFGIGKFNPVQLSKILNGRQLNVAASIGPRTENINGYTSVADLETALQLVYLQFTSPRTDSLLFHNIINNAKDGLSTRYADPNNVFSDTISYVMGNYAYRSSPSTAARLDQIKMQDAYNIYRERFADASGFTFVFVGNFDAGKITPLIARYLGSLPALHKNEKARDLGIHIPEGQFTKKVYKGTENKAVVRLLISGDYQFNAVNNLLLKALGDILQIKILEHLREDESEVYNPSVQSLYNKYPQNRYAFTISFGCAPKNVDHLIEMVEKEMAALRNTGPMPDDVDKFKAAYNKNVELALKDNSFWLSYLSGQYENGEPVLQVEHIQENLKQVTVPALQAAAKLYLSGKNLIRFELVPEKPIVN